MSARPRQLPLLDLPAVPHRRTLAERNWEMLRLVEAIRYDPERLARYVRDDPSAVGFLDHVICQLTGWPP